MDVKGRRFVALQIGVLSLVAGLIYFALWVGHPEKKRMLFACIAFLLAGVAWIYGLVRRRP